MVRARRIWYLVDDKPAEECMPSRSWATHRTVTPLRAVIEATEKLTGCKIESGYVDKGCRGHDTESRCRIFISGQNRGVFDVIKRELRRRYATEPMIGHMKADGHIGRSYPKGRAGDTANGTLAAVGPISPLSGFLTDDT
jgi:hypothetical protein